MRKSTTIVLVLVLILSQCIFTSYASTSTSISASLRPGDERVYKIYNFNPGDTIELDIEWTPSNQDLLIGIGKEDDVIVCDEYSGGDANIVQFLAEEGVYEVHIIASEDNVQNLEYSGKLIHE